MADAEADSFSDSSSSCDENVPGDDPLSNHELVERVERPKVLLRHILRYYEKENPDLHKDREFEKVTAQETRHDQVVALLAALRYTGPPEVRLPRFVWALRKVQGNLADELFPLKYRALWFCSSPAYAAAAVHVLSPFPAEAPMCVQCVQSQGSCLYQRVSSGVDIEVCVAFPADGQSLSVAMETAFVDVCPGANVAVMSGECGCGCEGTAVEGGDVIIVTKASDGRQDVSSDQGIVQNLRQTLSSGLPEWVRKELKAGQGGPIPPHHYQSLWLCRLYSELQKALDSELEEEKSKWLETIGWDLSNPCKLNAHNQAVLAREAPDWPSGRLASVLLENGSQWSTDPKSPLGLSPTQTFLDCVQRKVHASRAQQGSQGQREEYPASVKGRAPSEPLFGPVLSAPPGHSSASSDSLLSVLAYDPDSCRFLSLCGASAIPCLVCKGVAYSVPMECGTDASIVCSYVCTEALKSFFNVK